MDCGGADGVNNTVENNLFYRVDIGIGPLNWSDAGIDSGAAESGPDSRSSFAFRRNILVVDSGAMFAGSTSNGYQNMSFSGNVYWDLSSHAAAAVSFPCDPDFGHSIISGCVKASGAATQISSPSGAPNLPMLPMLPTSRALYPSHSGTILRVRGL